MKSSFSPVDPEPVGQECIDGGPAESKPVDHEPVDRGSVDSKPIDSQSDDELTSELRSPRVTSVSPIHDSTGVSSTIESHDLPDETWRYIGGITNDTDLVAKSQDSAMPTGESPHDSGGILPKQHQNSEKSASPPEEMLAQVDVIYPTVDCPPEKCFDLATTSRSPGLSDKSDIIGPDQILADGTCTEYHPAGDSVPSSLRP